LRAAGHDTAAVVESARGAPDEDVIDLAVRQERILITEDTDFGQLVMEVAVTYDVALPEPSVASRI
jgi:predicted nuclease of predicted toxin-antitoxin system